MTAWTGMPDVPREDDPARVPAVLRCDLDVVTSRLNVPSLHLILTSDWLATDSPRDDVEPPACACGAVACCMTCELGLRPTSAFAGVPPGGLWAPISLGDGPTD